MAHTPGVLKDRKDELFADFADGQLPKDLTDKYGVHASTLHYHFKQWEKGGKLDPRGGAPVGQDTTPPQTSAAEPETGRVPISADLELVFEAETPAPVVQDPPPVAEVVPAPAAPSPAGDQGDRPATEEEIRRLAEVLQGKTAPPPTPTQPANKEPKIQLVPPAKPPQSPAQEWGIETGRVYEGAVAQIADSYVLVDMIELANMQGKCPRGKVSREEVADRVPGNLRNYRGLKEGDLVNVKVLSVNRDPHRNKWFINLSIKQAPPYKPEPHHLPQPEPEKKDPVQADTKREKVLAQAGAALSNEDIDAGAREKIADQVAPKLHDELLAAQQEISALGYQLELARKQNGTTSLCSSCVHHMGPFCRFKAFYDDEIPLDEQYKDKHVAHIQVTYGPRPVISCDAHTPLDAVRKG